MSPSSLEATPMERPMAQQLDDLSRSLTPLDQDSTIIAVIEMSQASWLVAGIVPGRPYPRWCPQGVVWVPGPRALRGQVVPRRRAMTGRRHGPAAHRKPDLAQACCSSRGLPAAARRDSTSKCLIRGIVHHDEPNRLAKERDVAFAVAVQARSLRQGAQRLLNKRR